MWKWTVHNVVRCLGYLSVLVATHASPFFLFPQDMTLSNSLGHITHDTVQAKIINVHVQLRPAVSTFFVEFIKLDNLYIDVVEK